MPKEEPNIIYVDFSNKRRVTTFEEEEPIYGAYDAEPHLIDVREFKLKYKKYLEDDKHLDIYIVDEILLFYDRVLNRLASYGKDAFTKLNELYDFLKEILNKSFKREETKDYFKRFFVTNLKEVYESFLTNFKGRYERLKKENKPTARDNLLNFYSKILDGLYDLFVLIKENDTNNGKDENNVIYIENWGKDVNRIQLYYDRLNEMDKYLSL